jgi:hypothetical protein
MRSYGQILKDFGVVEVHEPDKRTPSQKRYEYFKAYHQKRHDGPAYKERRREAWRRWAAKQRMKK